VREFRADHHNDSFPASPNGNPAPRFANLHQRPIFAFFFAAVLTLASTISTASAQSTASAKRLATNLLGFGIPFQIDSRDPNYVEVQLYLSDDRGKTWRFLDRKATSDTEFPFKSAGDGEYWFALKTLDRNRQLIPEGKTEPELIIVVDTVKPELAFQIQTDPAGRVDCRWQASDPNLDPTSFQISYQDADSTSDPRGEIWTNVPVDLKGKVLNGRYADQIAWWPEFAAKVLNVRIVVADTAGNHVQQIRQVVVPETPWRHRSTGTARVGDPPSSGQQPAIDGYQQLQKTAEPFPSTPPPLDPSIAKSDNQPICENGVCQVPDKKRTPTDGRFASSGNDLLNVGGHGLIGSPPEIAAPPVPRGYQPPAGRPATETSSRVAQTNPAQTNPAQTNPAQTNPAQTNPAQPNPTAGTPATNERTGASDSVSWNSEPERWTLKNQVNSSTALNPDPSILPQPNEPSRPPIRNLPAPNPQSTKLAGEQVIVESTTGGPHNQYRGLAPPKTPDQSVAIQDAVNRSTPPSDELENWQSEQPDTYQTASSNNQDVESQSQAQSVLREPIESAVGDQGLAESDIGDSSVQMIGSKRFRLNYGIDAIDPSGVAKVDLWMTRDGGQSWQNWGTDPDSTSPFPVEVAEEGRYGFRIVVHSKDGLTGRGPSSGDRPDLWVHVDTAAPLAQIVSVPYGRGNEAGRLIINYRVVDPHLTLRPITLSYSRNPAGPWTTIAEGVRNESRYVWKPEGNVPDRIFLRLEARDRAGNRGVHQLTQAIDVSGLVPRGTIHGVTPVVATP